MSDGAAVVVVVVAAATLTMKVTGARANTSPVVLTTSVAVTVASPFLTPVTVTVGSVEHEVNSTYCGLTVATPALLDLSSILRVFCPVIWQPDVPSVLSLFTLSFVVPSAPPAVIDIASASESIEPSSVL